MFNAFRFALIAFLSVTGLVAIGVLLLIYFSSGTDASLTKRLNSTFFQVRADAEVDRLIAKGVFTPAQEPDLRGFVRRTYVSDLTVLIYGVGSGLLAVGIASISGAYCVWMSYRLSKLAARL